MSLQAELRAFHADFMGQVPAEIAAAMTQADLELSASGIFAGKRAMCAVTVGGGERMRRMD
jgi:hypothetical protein